MGNLYKNESKPTHSAKMFAIFSEGVKDLNFNFGAEESPKPCSNLRMSDDEWEDVASEIYEIDIQGYSNSADETVPLYKAEKMKVIGMETPNPILQINGFIFKGKSLPFFNFDKF